MPRHYDNYAYAHYLTFSCYRRLWLFRDDELYSMFVDNLDESRQRWGFKLWAFVIMPTHVHLLLWPQPETTISKILFAIKRPFAIQAIDHLRGNWQSISEHLIINRTGQSVRRFWQAGGGYDRNIYGEVALRKTIDYIHNNPVRHNLVKTVTDWKWSSARFWMNGREYPLRMDIPPL